MLKCCIGRESSIDLLYKIVYKPLHGSGWMSRSDLLCSMPFGRCWQTNPDRAGLELGIWVGAKGFCLCFFNNILRIEIAILYPAACGQARIATPMQGSDCARFFFAFTTNGT